MIRKMLSVLSDQRAKRSHGVLGIDYAEKMHKVEVGMSNNEEIFSRMADQVGIHGITATEMSAETDVQLNNIKTLN